jgi:ABC-type branched-subunit amino acid transport system ATPase component
MIATVANTQLVRRHGLQSQVIERDLEAQTLLSGAEETQKTQPRLQQCPHALMRAPTAAIRNLLALKPIPIDAGTVQIMQHYLETLSNTNKAVVAALTIGTPMLAHLLTAHLANQTQADDAEIAALQRCWSLLPVLFDTVVNGRLSNYVTTNAKPALANKCFDGLITDPILAQIKDVQNAPTDTAQLPSDIDTFVTGTNDLTVNMVNRLVGVLFMYISSAKITNFNTANIAFSLLTLCIYALIKLGGKTKLNEERKLAADTEIRQRLTDAQNCGTEIAQVGGASLLRERLSEALTASNNEQGEISRVDRYRYPFFMLCCTLGAPMLGSFATARNGLNSLQIAALVNNLGFAFWALKANIIDPLTTGEVKREAAQKKILWFIEAVAQINKLQEPEHKLLKITYEGDFTGVVNPPMFKIRGLKMAIPGATGGAEALPGTTDGAEAIPGTTDGAENGAEAETLLEKRTRLLADSNSLRINMTDPISLAAKTDSISLEAGKIYHLNADSGCGKSTLFNVLAGLYPFVEADINFRCKKDEIVIVPQKTPIMGRDTLLHELTFPQDPSTKDIKKIERLMHRLKFTSQQIHAMKNKLSWSKFSGGEEKKIAVMRLLTHEPKPRVVLIDELTAGMNADLKKDAETLIREELSEATIIYICHYEKGHEIMEGTTHTINFERNEPGDSAENKSMRLVVEEYTRPRPRAMTV